MVLETVQIQHQKIPEGNIFLQRIFYVYSQSRSVGNECKTIAFAVGKETSGRSARKTHIYILDIYVRSDTLGTTHLKQLKNVKPLHV